MQEIDYYINCISNIFNQNKRVAIVIAPMFNECNITDGYFQRIKAIDETILGDFIKLYLNIQEDYTALVEDECFLLSKIDENHYEVKIDPRGNESSEIIEFIIRNGFLTYIHCVLRMIKRSTGTALRNAISSIKTNVVWDVHGSVPEEFVLYNDYWGSQEASEAELFMAKRADIYIVVNESMRKHLKRKYGSNLRGICVILPIFMIDLKNKLNDVEKIGTRIIYAGGLQKWQKIDEMQSAISLQGNRYEYYMCVSNTQIFNEIWGQLPRPLSMFVGEMKPNDLFSLYPSCKYGFVLRDDCIINNVACPTKLIEYIQFGIIPIMDSPHIGDFVELGLEYVPINSFNNGYLPNEICREQMVNRNMKILDLLKMQHDSGEKKLKMIINSSKIYNICHIALILKSKLKKKRNHAVFLKSKASNHIGSEINSKYYYICNFSDVSELVSTVGTDRVYSTNGISINNVVYGNSLENLLSYLDNNSIYDVQVDSNKMSIWDFCNYIEGML